MADNKKAVVVYSDWIKKFEALEDDEAGRLIKHFFRYVNDLNPIAPDRITELSFIDIESTLKRDLVKWEVRAERSRKNGLHGGRPQVSQVTNKPTITQRVILKPKEPDSVNVSVIDSVNVNDNVISNKQPSRDALILPENVGDEFLRTWEDLIKQKKWKKKSPSALKYSLKILEKYSEVEGIEMMAKAIAGDWQGLVEPQNNFKNGNFKQNNASGSATEALKNW